jgi:hypothetical protein
LVDADTFIKKKEEENAYILLTRYFNILMLIQKRPDFKNETEMVKRMLGGNEEQRRRMEQLRVLKDSLIARDKMIPARGEVLESSLETAIASDVIPETTLVEMKQTISSQELNEMMENESKRVLILDCRSEKDYEESKITFNFICNVPDNLCILGQSADKIRKKLPNDSIVCWEMRKNRRTIVIMDWFSESFVRNTPVWHLKSILLEWDEEMEKKPEIILLKGGYENWITLYPTKTTNPKVIIPKSNDLLPPSLDNIEYPHLEDIAMKDQSFNSTSNGTPLVDRSKKADAINASTKMLSQEQLLVKKEELLDKSIHNEKELLKLGNELDIEFSANKENIEDASHNQKLYMIWELDSKQTDVERQQKTIDKELEYVRQNTFVENGISKIQELERRLAEKQNEDAKMKMERTQKAKQIEEKARKNKKPIDEHKSPIKAPRKNEIILSPKTLNSNTVPQFDRASKPFQANQNNFYDNQDFAPVYQKTVSNRN